MSRFQYARKAGIAGLAVGTGGLLALWILPKVNENRKFARRPTSVLASEVQEKLAKTRLPSKLEQVQSLKTKEFDILVIGGGATGCGVALDAASRGLQTALVEKYDFSSGTSSRSTKLIHGGVRYLQKAIMGLDLEQYRMVKEALSERANLIEIAPHLAYPLPIMLPVYRYWQVPYFWAGIKAYDLVAGRETLKSSYLLSKSKALELFPMLKENKLKGAIVYYDGQHDDARMCISIAITAARMGANVANHTEVTQLLKRVNEAGKEVVSGVRVLDKITGEEYDIKAKSVVNATGPYTDSMRQLDDGEAPKICAPSSGVHIVLPNYYSPEKMGLLDPATSDGRVIFFLPWQNHTMAGTTDSPCAVTDNPTPTEDEIQFILGEIRNYLNPDVNVRRGDVLSAWSGIRPLVRDPNAKNTQSIARNHIINVSNSNLVTIAGGKWTTYRHMAEETVDKAIEVCGLEAKSGCVTQGLKLDGAHSYTPTMFIRLIQDFGVDSEVAQHLASTYGDRAFDVAKLANLTGNRWPILGKRLHEEYPYLEAEVLYAVREYAASAIDIIARRTRLAFLNVIAAEEALPRVIEIMAGQLKWDKKRQQVEHDNALRFLSLEMGRTLKVKAENVPINFSKEEVDTYIKRFSSLDYESKGYITIIDLRKYFKKMGEAVTEDQLHEILSEVDLNKNGQVDLAEFLQLMSAVKTGAVSTSRFATAARLMLQCEQKNITQCEQRIPTDRSGGGV